MAENRLGNGAGSFGAVLRGWRRYRGLSQLDLSLDAGISSRHVSFLETGRSNPSREMVQLIAEALDLPLRERNRLLLAAGYAPAFSESALDSEAMIQVRKAVRLLLHRHEPYPAYAMDGAWNVVDTNRIFDGLRQRLLPEAGEEADNILRLFLSPGLLRPFVVNWATSARLVLHRVLRQLHAPARPSELSAVVEEIRGYPGIEGLLEGSADVSGFEVFIPITIQLGGARLNWLTTIVTFAGAVDITLDELVVECFFPADQATTEFMKTFEFS